MTISETRTYGPSDFNVTCDDPDCDSTFHYKPHANNKNPGKSLAEGLRATGWRTYRFWKVTKHRCPGCKEKE